MVSVTPGQHSVDAYSDKSFRNAYDNDWIEMSWNVYSSSKEEFFDPISKSK